MASPRHKQTPLSFREYQALEESAGENTRYEFIDGLVYALSGGTVIHNRIIQNCAFFLRGHFRPEGCQVLTENVKLEVARDKSYVYPDVMVSCSERDWQASQLIRDPVLILEVLSESTERKDLIQKVELYRAIPGLRAYVIIDQYSCWLRVYERNANGDWEAHRHLTRREEILSLPDFPWQLPLEEIYRDVEVSG